MAWVLDLLQFGAQGVGQQPIIGTSTPLNQVDDIADGVLTAVAFTPIIIGGELVDIFVPGDRVSPIRAWRNAFYLGRDGGFTAEDGSTRTWSDLGPYVADKFGDAVDAVVEPFKNVGKTALVAGLLFLAVMKGE